jgi:hypothetical protein
MPARRTGVVVFTNDSDLGGRLADAATMTTYNALKRDTASNNAMVTLFERELPRQRERMREEARQRAARSQKLPYPLTAYSGTYEDIGLGRLTCVVDGNGLVFSIGQLRSRAEVFDGDKNQFRVELTGSGSVIEFNVANGKAVAATFMGATFTRAE